MISEAFKSVFEIHFCPCFYGSTLSQYLASLAVFHLIGYLRYSLSLCIAFSRALFFTFCSASSVHHANEHAFSSMASVSLLS